MVPCVFSLSIGKPREWHTPSWANTNTIRHAFVFWRGGMRTVSFVARFEIGHTPWEFPTSKGSHIPLHRLSYTRSISIPCIFANCKPFLKFFQKIFRVPKTTIYKGRNSFYSETEDRYSFGVMCSFFLKIREK